MLEPSLPLPPPALPAHSLPVAGGCSQPRPTLLWPPVARTTANKIGRCQPRSEEPSQSLRSGPADIAAGTPAGETIEHISGRHRGTSTHTRGSTSKRASTSAAPGLVGSPPPSSLLGPMERRVPYPEFDASSLESFGPTRPAAASVSAAAVEKPSSSKSHTTISTRRCPPRRRHWIIARRAAERFPGGRGALCERVQICMATLGCNLVALTVSNKQHRCTTARSPH